MRVPQAFLTEKDDINNTIKQSIDNYAAVEIKIGINYGTTLLDLAIHNPSILYIGIELKKENSMEAYDKAIEKRLDNVVIVNGEASSVLKSIELNNFVSQVHVYFPTPFPSSLGLNERLINYSFSIELYRLLHSGGIFRFVTDHKDYYFDVLYLFSSANWQALDWCKLNLNIDEDHFTGTYCEREFRAKGRSIHVLQVVKWG